MMCIMLRWALCESVDLLLLTTLGIQGHPALTLVLDRRPTQFRLQTGESVAGVAGKGVVVAVGDRLTPCPQLLIALMHGHTSTDMHKQAQTCTYTLRAFKHKHSHKHTSTVAYTRVAQVFFQCFAAEQCTCFLVCRPYSVSANARYVKVVTCAACYCDANNLSLECAIR